MSVLTNKLFLAWMALTVAIIAEVTGTSMMVESARHGGYLGYIIMMIALAVSYYFLAVSVRKIAVGVAYAVWEGLGLVLLTIIGVVIFKESLNTQEIIGLLLAVTGIVCVAIGEGE